MKEYLRLATPNDMELLFEWANDDEVRKNSFYTERIRYDEHKEWFEKLLKKENCRQYIYCADGGPAGQVRVTVDGNKAEIGYSISKERRGQGHSKRMLQLLRIQIKCDFPEVKVLVAKVKPDNFISQKVFVGLGYEEKHRQYEFEI